MARLYLFTTEFPYGGGENFLEQEVPFLAQAFDEVTIVPTRDVRARGAPRGVPDNVRIDLGLSDPAQGAAAGDHLAFKARNAAREMVSRPRVVTRRGDMQRLWYYLQTATRARQWLAENDLRNAGTRVVLYTYWYGGTTFGLASARVPGVTLVSRAHRGDLYESAHPSGYLPFLRDTIRRLDRLFTVSEHGRAYLLGRWPRLADKVAVARLGVPDPHHTTAASTDGMLRIVSCSHISPVKRIPLIIEGIDRFARDHPDIQVAWRHLGDGPDRAELAELARSTFPDTVDGALVGRLPPGGIIDHYRRNPVDLFINASRSEGVPVSIMEAQSCGIPVVATDVGGTSEIVHHTNGVLLPSDPTAVQVAAAIRELWMDGKERRVASKETWRSRGRAEHTFPAFAAALQALAPPARD